MSVRVEQGQIRVEQGQKRVRAYLGGELVADTIRPLLVWENPYYPQYYFPADDVRAKLIPTGDTAFDLELSSGSQVSGVAGRHPEVEDAVRFEFAAMDEWLEEDEPIYVHPRNPYTRVDILASSRHVRVEMDGVTVAESRSPRILFETGLPPRYYLPLPDLRRDLLRPSDSATQCPYKGTAGYWSVDTGHRVHKDVVWIYRTPLPESRQIAGLACFYNERVDLYVDDVKQDRPSRR
jgi:uncharacterized protein (DUF427 family)